MNIKHPPRTTKEMVIRSYMNDPNQKLSDIAAKFGVTKQYVSKVTGEYLRKKMQPLDKRK